MTAAMYQAGEARSVLTAIFEKGFQTARGTDSELAALENGMRESGMAHGSELTRDLRKSFALFSGDTALIADTAKKYALLWEYLDNMSKQLLVMNIAEKINKTEENQNG